MKRFVVCAMFCLLVPLVLVAEQAASPWFGTWRLDTEKSTSSDGNVAKSMMLTISDGTWSIEGVSKSGTPVKMERNGSELVFWDASGKPGKLDFAEKTIDDRTMDSVWSFQGQTVRTNHHVLSPDLKTITVTTTGVQRTGESYESVSVWRKVKSPKKN